MVKNTKVAAKKSTAARKRVAAKKQSRSSVQSHIDKFEARVPLYTVTLGVAFLMLFATIATM